jgi:hypothetical protein
MIFMSFRGRALAEEKIEHYLQSVDGECVYLVSRLCGVSA